MKKRNISCILIFLISLICIYKEASGKTESYQWVKNSRFVSHALGGIDGKTYTNSLEALEANYEKGHRVFEVDLVLTSDNKLVARHDWLEMFEQKFQTSPQENKPMTLEQFKNMKIFRKYTPLDFNDICIFMNKHKDVYLITDTKETTKENINSEFSVLVDTAQKINKDILERVIPQIYNQEMLPLIKNLYNFENIIYTLYASHDSNEQVIDFVAKNNIKVVTVHKDRATKDFLSRLSQQGIYTYVHTINSITEMENLINENGAYGVYTDFLIPRDLNYMKIK